jgi:hypothetical protein
MTKRKQPTQTSAIRVLSADDLARVVGGGGTTTTTTTTTTDASTGQSSGKRQHGAAFAIA